WDLTGPTVAMAVPVEVWAARARTIGSTIAIQTPVTQRGTHISIQTPIAQGGSPIAI
ncbi:hypothetical protein N341_04909, partial [Tyto alba]